MGITLKDIINENEDCKVIIAERGETDTDPMHKRLYEGLLSGIPEEMHGCKVVEISWAIGAQCHFLTVPRGTLETIKKEKQSDASKGLNRSIRWKM